MLHGNTHSLFCSIDYLTSESRSQELVLLIKSNTHINCMQIYIYSNIINNVSQDNIQVPMVFLQSLSTVAVKLSLGSGKILVTCCRTVCGGIVFNVWQLDGGGIEGRDFVPIERLRFAIATSQTNGYH